MLDVQVVARSYLQLSSSCSIHYQVNRWLEFEQQVNFRQVRATHDGDFKGWNLGHDDGGGQDCSNRNLGDARGESSGHYNNIHANPIRNGYLR